MQTITKKTVVLAVVASLIITTAVWSPVRAARVFCNLVAPPNPLTATALSTPWQVQGCNEADLNVAVFVQATIFDPATNQVSVYNPLVVTDGTAPAAPPSPVTLPAGAVVALWVGANQTVLVVGQGSDGFVQGSRQSLFTQQAYLNVPAFLAAIAGHVTPPPLGAALDGAVCPTSRDFMLVDQDQSDNTTATELVTAGGRTAQDTPANRALLGNGFVFNGSDERLLAAKVDKALGCTPWKVPDRADLSGSQKLTAGLLLEVQAAAYQAAPVALVPALDPFVLNDGAPNLAKLNVYRAQIDQPQVATLAGADTASYCRNLLSVGEPRLKADQAYMQPVSSPFPGVADSLFTFVAQRFAGTWSLLGCQNLIGVVVPVTLTYNQAGVVTGATWR